MTFCGKILTFILLTIDIALDQKSSVLSTQNDIFGDILILTLPYSECKPEPKLYSMVKFYMKKIKIVHITYFSTVFST